MTARASKMKKMIVVALFGCLGALGATGCQGPGLFGGENGEIGFEHEDGTGFSSPRLVRGGELDLDLRKTGSNEPLQILSVESTDPEVMDITSWDRDRVTIRGLQAGSAQLEVEAETDTNDPVRDILNVEVFAPVEHSIRHECTDSKMAHYLPDKRYTLPVELLDGDGRSLSGDRVSFVELDGDAIEIDPEESDANELVIGTGMGGARGKATSTVDGSEVSFGVATLDEADGLNTNKLFFRDKPLSVGSVDGISFQPSIAGDSLCGYDFPMQIEPLTPDVCTATDDGGEEFDGNVSLEGNVILLSGDAVGDCKFDVTLEDPQTGATVSQTVTLPIAEAPEE